MGSRWNDTLTQVGSASPLQRVCWRDGERGQPSLGICVFVRVCESLSASVFHPPLEHRNKMLMYHTRWYGQWWPAVSAARVQHTRGVLSPTRLNLITAVIRGTGYVLCPSPHLPTTTTVPNPPPLLSQHDSVLHTWPQLGGDMHRQRKCLARWFVYFGICQINCILAEYWVGQCYIFIPWWV